MSGRNNMIIFEDESYIICHKRAGIPTQTADLRSMDLMHELTACLARRKPGDRNPYLGLINRLDQPVEGLVLVAKNEKAAAILNGQLRDHSIHKHYLAVVEMRQELETHCEYSLLTDYIIHDKKSNLAVAADEHDANARCAKLYWRFLGCKDSLALLEIELLTGRHHQIRFQLSHAGYPLLGDTKYGTQASRAISSRYGCTSVALCAYRLCFRHPVSGKAVEYRVEPRNPLFHILND